LGEDTSSLYLRGDGRNIGDHKKKRSYWGFARARKKVKFPTICQVYGDEE
jgi:hypothetical protein